MRTVIEEAVSQLAEMGLHAEWLDEPGGGGRARRGTLMIRDGERHHELPALAVPSFGPVDASLLSHDPGAVLLTDRVPPAGAGVLRDYGWGGYVDSAGNASLRGDGLFVEIVGRRGSAARRPRSAAAPFTRAGLPVTFMLLVASHHGVTLTQRALAECSGASVGTVNRVVAALRERVPSMMEERGHQLLRPSVLEEEWISAYSALQPIAWPEERFRSDVWERPADVLEDVLPPGALLGSEAAAARLDAPIRPQTVLVHVESEDARRALIRHGRLRRSEDGEIRIRPSFWRTLPWPPENGAAPRLLLRADLLLEADPRLEEIQDHLRGACR